MLTCALWCWMGRQVKRRDGTVASIDKRRGFVDYYRNPDPYRDPLDRVFDWNEIRSDDGHDEVERKVQAARCMDCGTPFCQTHTGCPVNNLIPEWNELVFKDQWKEAIDRYALSPLPFNSRLRMPPLCGAPFSHPAPALRLACCCAGCTTPTTSPSSRAWCARRRARGRVWRAWWTAR